MFFAAMYNVKLVKLETITLASSLAKTADGNKNTITEGGEGGVGK